MILLEISQYELALAKVNKMIQANELEMEHYRTQQTQLCKLLFFKEAYNRMISRSKH